MNRPDVEGLKRLCDEPTPKNLIDALKSDVQLFLISFGALPEALAYIEFLEARVKEMEEKLEEEVNGYV